MSAYKFCKPFAAFHPGQPSFVSIHARIPDSPWLVGPVDANIDKWAPGAYISCLDYDLSGQGSSQIGTLDVLVAGFPSDTHPVIRLVKGGHLFDESDSSTIRLRQAAMATLWMPIDARSQLHVKIVTTDDKLMIRTTSMVALRHGGSIHRWHSEVQNCGRYSGTADFTMDALIGFESIARADAAAIGFESLPCDLVRVTKLYDGEHAGTFANAA
ncbi:hypothetical protein RAS2_16490 [Phycisphaerae bacterium RAS2]|nr:hypothetical protein RAS2_16490 [Phycisphaerae bacterium RAS2]